MLFIFTEDFYGRTIEFAADSQSDLVNKIIPDFNDPDASFTCLDNYREFCKHTHAQEIDKERMMVRNEAEDDPFSLNDQYFATFFDDTIDELNVSSFKTIKDQKKAEYDYWIDKYDDTVKSLNIIKNKATAKKICRDLYGNHRDYDSALTRLMLN